MQVFKTDKKLFWTNELKSWLWTFAIAALMYFSLNYFFHKPGIVSVYVLLLLKLSDTLTQYHVREIQIDGQKNELTVILISRMSGQKINRYELDQTFSELIINSGLTRFLARPFTLNIFLNPKKTFVISNRYGFTLETLTSVDKLLRSTKTQS